MTEDNYKLYVRKFQTEIIDIKNNICVKFLIGVGRFLYVNPKKYDVLYKALYDTYGNTIIFSKRNLRYCKLLYHKYFNNINLIPENISWNNLVILFRRGNSIAEDMSILRVIENYSLNEIEAKYFIRNHYIRKFGNGNILSNITEEFVNLKEI